MGGAQAIGAVAYGTESIGPVDKIVGPGNAWVTAAKLEVLDRCAIDMPAGPTEVMVVADDAANAGPRGRGPAQPGRARARLPCRARDDLGATGRCGRGGDRAPAARCCPRRDTLAASLAAAGRSWRPTTSPRRSRSPTSTRPSTSPSTSPIPTAALVRLRHAGSVFLGDYSPESAGDYASGSNHILPTPGLARGPTARCRVEAFGRWMQVDRITRDGLAAIRASHRRRRGGRGPHRASPRRGDPIRTGPA